jgi:hypothetical protein
LTSCPGRLTQTKHHRQIKQMSVRSFT